MKTLKRTGFAVVAVCLLITAQVLAAGKLGKLGGGSGEKKLLTLAEVEPQLALLAGTTLDVFAKEKVEYGAVGDSKYDEVCRNSAIAYGSLKVAQTMMADAQQNLAQYAKDHQARGETKRQIKELEADGKLTPEESAAAIKGAKQAKGKFTKDEVAYFAKMSGNLAVASAALAKGIESAGQLSQQIPNLLTSAKSDFSGPTNALKLKAATENLNLARNQVQDVPAEGKKTATDLAKYAAIVKELHGETKDLTPVD